MSQGKKAPADTAPEAPRKNEGILEGKKDSGERKTTKGRYGRNKRKYDAADEEATRFEGAKRAKDTTADNFLKEMAEKSARGEDYSIGDIKTADALIDMDRVKPGDDLFGKVEAVAGSASTKIAQALGLLSKFNIKTASAGKISSRFGRRLDNLGVKLSKSGAKKQNAAATKFTKQRDNVVPKLLKKATDSDSKKDVDAYIKAKELEETLLKEARIVEYEVALKEALKGLKKGEKLHPDTRAGLKKMKNEAGVFQYDAVDSSLLSATGTMIHNFFNGLVGLTEVQLGGKAAAFKARRKGKTTGGASWQGLKTGFIEGKRSIRQEITNRNKLNAAEGGGRLKKGWGAYKNAITTGNELSELLIRARIQSKLYDHYRQLNKADGLTGDALKQRSRLNAAEDPYDLKKFYEEEAYITQGMSSISKSSGIHNRKLERDIQNFFKKGLPSGTKRADDVSEFVSKVATRFFFSYPTVIWKSGVMGGVKRTPLVGYMVDTTRIKRAKAMKKDKDYANRITALEAERIEHAISSVTYATAGGILGATGIVTGAYPSDPNEQERWQTEGKTEWSIRIPTGERNKDGSLAYNYHDLRKSLGAFALPLMLGAQAGQNHRNGDPGWTGIIPDAAAIGRGNSSGSVLTAIADVMPVDSPLRNLENAYQTLTGQETKWPDISASLVRMGMPASGATNELAKIITAMASGTELDVKTDDKEDPHGLQEFMNRLAVSLPGMGELAGLPSKKVGDIEVNAVSPFGRFLGATKGHNPEGVASNKRKQDKANNSAAVVLDGVTSGDSVDKIRASMDSDDARGLYDTLLEGKELAPEKMKKVQDAISKLTSKSEASGVYESKFSESGDWGTHLAILKTLKDVRKNDPAETEGDRQNLDREITRVDITKKNNFDPKVYTEYGNISSPELKRMLDPESDEYDSSFANQLIAIDKAFTAKGVSRNTSGLNGWERAKYDLEKILGGSGKKGKGIATNVTTGKVMTSDGGGGGLKYRKTVGNLPNFAASTPKKNFKKTISVKKGVQL